MLHTILSSGKSAFITPVVAKKDGKVEVNVNSLAGGQFALNVAYIAIASFAKSATDNRFDNATVRKAVKEVYPALKDAGKPSDIFAVYDPKTESAIANTSDLSQWNLVYTVTRESLLKACEAIAKIDALMAKAESESLAIANAFNNEVKKVGELSVFYTGEAGTRAKRAGKVISI